jgi:hypothetical protein
MQILYFVKKAHNQFIRNIESNKYFNLNCIIHNKFIIKNKSHSPLVRSKFRRL